MNTIFKILLIFLFFQISSRELYSQDTLRYFIGYDLFKGIINEHSFTFGYNLKKHHAVTLSLGYTYDNKNLRDMFKSFSPSQDNYPFMVYKGPTFRTGYEYRFSPIFYLGIDLFYKYLYYLNQTFVDANRKDNSVTYAREEHANVFGWHINTGLMIVIPKIHLFFNPSIGLGETIRDRTYTTTSTTNGYMAMPLGTYSEKLKNFSILMNLNIGIMFGK
jgi:hypothetical protein